MCIQAAYQLHMLLYHCILLDKRVGKENNRMGAAHASCRRRSAKPCDTKVAALGSSNQCTRILAFSSQVRSSMKILTLYVKRESTDSLA